MIATSLMLSRNERRCTTFPSTDVAVAVHDRQLAEHGGPAGVKDMGLPESGVTRPINKHGYAEADPCALAAAYAYDIARSRPFADGNWGAVRGLAPAPSTEQVDIVFDEADAIRTMLALVGG